MGTAENPEERQVVCPACLKVFPEYLVHVIPYYNSVAEEYVTTYRCEECWLPALAETRARLESTEDEAKIASAAAFFERHGVFLHEFRRGDPLPVVQKMLVQMIDLLQSAAIRLPIGPLEPQG
jgi:hypothetical protein